MTKKIKNTVKLLALTMMPIMTLAQEAFSTAFNQEDPMHLAANSPAPSNTGIDLTKLTPEQSQALLKKAQSLTPDQLQAIAKNFQLPDTAPQISAPTTVASTQAAIKRMQQADQSLETLKRDQAFNGMMDEVLPMSPKQITKLHKSYDLTLQAKASSPTAPPTPHFSSLIVRLDPGSQPPVIRLAAGFVTSLLFTDTTGAPWPLTAYSIGDPQVFNIQWDQKGNALFVQSLKAYGHGNLAVRLWGLDTPVMLTLVSGQRNVDFRVDLQVPGRGPDAKPPVVETAFNAKVNPLLINILDGIPPKESIKLDLNGAPGDAWYVDNKIYFRTKLTVLSPAWIATVSSPDGTHVYEMMLTPYIIASQNGKTVDIKLSGL